MDDGIFSVLDYPFEITWISVIPGYHDSSGVYVPESTTPSSIKGHISDITEEEKQFLPEGVSVTGTKLFSTCVDGIQDGDRLQITAEDDTVTTWYVRRKPYTNNLIKKYTGISRTNYYITRQK